MFHIYEGFHLVDAYPGCPDDAVIYVYNKYHEVVYSTHMTGASDLIPLPSGGYIMFAGLTGESIGIS